MATSWLQSALTAVGVGSGADSLPSSSRDPLTTARPLASVGSDIALGTTTSAAPPTVNTHSGFSAFNLPETNARARIVIVGDPGTGRSTLLQLLTSADASTRLPDDQDAHSTPLRTASPLGAGSGGGDPGGTFTGVRLHTVASTFKSYWLELVTLPRGHFGSGARASIYSGVDGVIALYDAAVPRTLDAMWKHVAEVLAAIGPGATILKSGEDIGSRVGAAYGAGPPVPVLVVGTKCDLVPGLAPSYSATGRQGATHSRAASISDVVGVNELVMSKYSPPPPELFHAFFDQVIAARYYSPSPHGQYQQQQQYASHSTSTGGLSIATTGASTSYSYGAPPSPMLSTFSSAAHHGQPSQPLLAPLATPLLSSVHTPSVPTPKMHRSALLPSTPGMAGPSAAAGPLARDQVADPSTPSQGQQPVPARRRMVVAVGGAGGAPITGGIRVPGADGASSYPPSTPRSLQ